MMGTWSIDNFGNDDACDWGEGFVAAPSLDKLMTALRVVTQNEAYIEADECQEALAACEIIARISGAWVADNPFVKIIDRWIFATNPIINDDLLETAIKAVEKIEGAHSELRELWAESDEGEAWEQSMHQLKLRIMGVPVDSPYVSGDPTMSIADEDADPETEEDRWFEAAVQGDIETIQAMYAGDAQILCAQDETQKTALHMSSLNGHEAVVEYLLSIGASVDATDEHGNTPFHMAVSLMWPGSAVLKLLAKHGCNVNAQDYENKETAIFLPAEFADADVVQDLLDLGVDPFIKNAKGKSAFDLAEDKIKTLIKAHQTRLN